MKSGNGGVLAGLLALVLVLGGVGLGAYFYLDAEDSQTTANAGKPVSEARIDKSETPSSGNASSDHASSESRNSTAKTETSEPIAPIESVAVSKPSESEPSRLDDAAIKEAHEAIAEANASIEPTFDPEKHTEFEVTVNGRVVNLSGAGVAGARVEAVLPQVTVLDSTREGFGEVLRRFGSLGIDRDSLTGGKYASGVKGSSVTDEAGNFRLLVKGFSKKEHAEFKFSVRASAEGFSPSTSDAVTTAAGREVDGIKIEIWRPGAIYGEVHLKGTTQPYVGAKVTASPVFSQGGRSASMDVTTATANSQPDGSFLIAGLRPGTYAVRAEVVTTTGNRSGAVTMFMMTTSEGSGMPSRSTTERKRIAVEEGKTAGPVSLEVEQPESLIFRLAPPATGTVNIKLEAGQAMGFGTVSFGSETGDVSPSAEGVYTVTGIKTSHRSIVITAAGFAPTSFKFTPLPGTVTDLGELTLDTGATIRGRVTRNGGVGLEGATLALAKNQTGEFQLVGVGFGGLGGPGRTVTSGVDGLFEFLNVETGGFRIRATCTGYAPVEAPVVVGGEGDPAVVVIDLFEGGYVSGTVQGPPDEPQPETPTNTRTMSVRLGSDGHSVVSSEDGAKMVAMCAEGGTGISWAGDQPLWMAQSSPYKSDLGPDGAYDIPNIPAGIYTAVAVWGKATTVQRGIEIKDGSRITLNFRFDVRGVVAGTVTGADGEPAAGLKVELVQSWWSDGDSKQSAVTDAAGRYRIGDLAPGVYYVRIEGEGRSSTEGTLQARKAEISDAAPSATVDVRLTGTNPSVRGRVTAGGAAAFKSVNLVSSTPSTSRTRTLNATVDAEGNFMIRDVAPGVYRIYCLDEQWQPRALVGRADLTVIAPTERPEEDVSFNYDFPVGSLSGTVRGPAGVSTESATASIRPLRPNGPNAWVNDMFGILEAAVKADGTFSLPTLVQGRYRVTVAMPGYAPQSADVEVNGAASVSLNIGQAAGTVEITVARFEGAPATAAPSGITTSFDFGRVKLVDANGKQVDLDPSAAFVYGNWQVGTTVTLPGLAPGNYTATLWGSTVEPLSMSVTAKENETTSYEVTMHKGAEIVLNLQNPAAEVSDTVFAGAVITLADARGNAVGVNSGAGILASRQTGRSRKITGLAPGIYTATVTVPGFAPAVVPVTLGRSANESLAFTLVPVATGG